MYLVVLENNRESFKKAVKRFLKMYGMNINIFKVQWPSSDKDPGGLARIAKDGQEFQFIPARVGSLSQHKEWVRELPPHSISETVVAVQINTIAG